MALKSSKKTEVRYFVQFNDAERREVMQALNLIINTMYMLGMADEERIKILGGMRGKLSWKLKGDSEPKWDEATKLIKFRPRMKGESGQKMKFAAVQSPYEAAIERYKTAVSKAGK